MTFVGGAIGGVVTVLVPAGFGVGCRRATAISAAAAVCCCCCRCVGFVVVAAARDLGLWSNIGALIIRIVFFGGGYIIL